jgi:peptidoglycan-N-acetylglucosamine deacetylase
MFIVFAAIAIATVAFAHAAPFPFALDAIAGDRAVWRMPGRPDGPRVYLTFDDGPNPTATPAVLDVLRKENVRATFFVIDAFLTGETASILRRMAMEGHEIALHSGTRRLAVLPPHRLADVLRDASKRIEDASGRPACHAFRPHAGFRSGSVFRAMQEIDYVFVGWGWNLWDWNWFRRREAASIVPRLIRHASDGDIIVIHDGHHKNPRADRRYAVETTARLIPELRARGFGFGTICDGLEHNKRAD